MMSKSILLVVEVLGYAAISERYFSITTSLGLVSWKTRNAPVLLKACEIYPFRSPIHVVSCGVRENKCLICSEARVFCALGSTLVSAIHNNYTLKQGSC